MTSILAHYSEVALKGKNRPWFIGRLVRHLHMALAGLSVKEIRTPMSRIEIVLGREATADEIRDRMSRVFGIANFSVAIRVPLDFDDLARDLGSKVWHARGWKVDLDHADLVISVEIVPGNAFLDMDKEHGRGGSRRC